MSRLDELRRRARQIVDGHREADGPSPSEMRARLRDRLERIARGEPVAPSEPRDDGEQADQRDIQRLRQLIQSARRTAKAEQEDDT